MNCSMTFHVKNQSSKPKYMAKISVLHLSLYISLTDRQTDRQDTSYMTVYKAPSSRNVSCAETFTDQWYFWRWQKPWWKLRRHGSAPRRWFYWRMMLPCFRRRWKRYHRTIKKPTSQQT